MSTKNNPGAYDCYANAGPDEPLFVLLARDKHAPTLVWLWATLRELDQDPAHAKAEADKAQVAEARDCVEDMLAWQVAHGRKSIGLAHATIGGLLELIRMANAGVAATAKNEGTRDQDVRRYLARTLFESSPPDPELATGLAPQAATGG